MPNWCSTTIWISGNKEKINKLDKEFKKATSANPYKTGFGNEWLGNLLAHIGIDPIDGKISCRGWISYYEKTDTEIYIETESAWVPHVQCIVKFADKFAPYLNITYEAQEPGCELYWTNDTDMKDSYFVDCWETKDGNEILEQSKEYWAEEDLKNALERVLGMRDTINKLIEEFDDRYGEYANIHRYEYVPLRELQ